MIRSILAVLSLSTSALSAQTYTWTGGGSDLRWSNPANWSGGLVPVSSPTAAIELNNPVSNPGFGSYSDNDLNALEVGSISFNGMAANGNAIRVHQQVRASNAPALVGGMAPLELVGNVQFISDLAVPQPGVLAQVPLLLDVIGSGSATFDGAWRVDGLAITGDVHVLPTGSLSAYADNHAFRSIRADGLIDMPGTLAVSAGNVVDFSRGTLDLGRNDSTLGSPVAQRLTIQGDLKLGKWQISGTGQLDMLADRIDVTGTLDLIQSDLLETSQIDYFAFPPAQPPPYIVLATYGNRVGSLDSNTIDLIASVSPGYYGTFPIIYTSAENAGPGEIRVVLPEPSILVTVAAAGLLVRRRREE